ncbi:MAG: hypothetical protein JO247_19960 [Chloroflexi bacterium]|nr:hypothetical protein [Chloroflexota bacterium]
MLQGRARAFVGIAVVALVLALAAGLFSIQYAQAYAQCSVVPSASACNDVSGARIAVDGLFVAMAGLLAAVVMAITTGINWSTSPAPNTALALRLAEEDEAFREEQARRAQLRDLNALAMAHLQQSAQAGSQAAAEAGAITINEDGTISTGSQVLIEEEEHVPTADERRRQVIADRLRQLARQHPDTVAEVVRTWIERPPGR